MRKANPAMLYPARIVLLNDMDGNPVFIDF
jgi:hypothetical protein